MSLTLYPAIDLKDGACVRLVQGEMAAATVFNDNPAAQAASFVEAGCQWLHVVDLNGAFVGRPVNSSAVAAILGVVDSAGAAGRRHPRPRHHRILAVGRRQPRHPGHRGGEESRPGAQACKRFPGRIAVGIDARDGQVAVEGWAETSELSALDLALRFEDAGVAAIIYTDIDRDGALGGVNVEATAQLAAKLSTPVIASGGVGQPRTIWRA